MTYIIKTIIKQEGRVREATHETEVNAEEYNEIVLMIDEYLIKKSKECIGN